MESPKLWFAGLYSLIDSISVNGMRSLVGFEHKLESGITVVYGPNGCGKTTILEAIHLLAQGFSFRAKDLKEAINWKSEEMLLRGHFAYDGRELNRGVRVHRRVTEVRENGESLRSVSALFGKCPAVIMQPSDIELLRGAPDIRRHWLDEILCYRSEVNGAVLRRYKRILQQRNQWLKQYKKASMELPRGGEAQVVGGEELFKILTEQLVDLGGKLWAARLSLSMEMSPIITEYYRKLSSGVDEITCTYKSSILKELDALDAAEFLDEENAEENFDSHEVFPSGKAVSEDVFRAAFARKLADLEFVEKMHGMTMAGPHRDDLALCIGGYELRSVGSQGQCRSAALAMRFAAVDVASRYLSKPILLLDDIFAELDTNRRNAVATLIREKECQVVIATPQKEDLPFMPDAEIEIGRQ